MDMSRSKCAWRREGQPISHALRDKFRETAAERDSTACNLTRHAEHRESSLAGELHNSILGIEIAAMISCAAAFTVIWNDVRGRARVRGEKTFSKLFPTIDFY